MQSNLMNSNVVSFYTTNEARGLLVLSSLDLYVFTLFSGSKNGSKSFIFTLFRFEIVTVTSCFRVHKIVFSVICENRVKNGKHAES